MMSNVINVVVLLSPIVFSITVMANRGSLPKIVSSYQKEHWLMTGDTLRLTCPVASDPAPIVTWRKDGDDIHFGWERFRTRNYSLLVKGVEPGDSGIYVCLATNGFGSVNVQYSVCVSGNETDLKASLTAKDVACNFNRNGEMPTFLKLHELREQYVQLIEGESTQLDCQASGKPRPEIRWFKDGDEKLRNHNNAGNEWLLSLNDVTVGDGGHYTCNVYNRIGSINYTYVVQVSNKLASLPEFRVSVLKNVTALIGSTAHFHCEAYSDVKTSIQWLRQVSSSRDRRNPNNTLVIEDKHFTVLQQGQTQAQAEGRYLSKLTIFSVDLNDSGIYVCSAANSHGYRLQSAFLNVISGKGNVDSELTRVDADGMSQFLPIVATIISIFLVLLLGIIVYFLFRRCLPSDKCASSSSSHQCSPSSESSFPVQRPNIDCQYNSFVPLKYHQHQQLLCPGNWIQGHHGGSQASDSVYVSSAGMRQYLSPSVVAQRDLLLYPSYAERVQL